MLTRVQQGRAWWLAGAISLGTAGGAGAQWTNCAEGGAVKVVFNDDNFPFSKDAAE